MTPRRASIGAALALLLGAACAETKSPPPPTYTGGAGAVVVEKCAGCHKRGDNVTPFPLETYDDVYAVRAAVRQAVADGTMPPWGAAPGCREYLDDRGLTPAQRGRLLAWLDAGAPRGEGDDPSVQGARSAHLSRVDGYARMPQPYTPQTTDGAPDENRCFLLDAPVENTSYITGLEFEPGNRAMNHHTFVWTVAPENVSIFTQLDAADPLPGWDCYGGLPLGSARPVGGWVPGMTATEFPEGLGVPIEPGGKVVLNIHYNTLYAPKATDQSGVRFKVRRNAQEMFVTAVVDPLWWSEGGMPIPAGEKDVTFEFKYRATLVTLGLLEFTLYNAALHMHRLGQAGRLYLERADGSRECLLDIPKFDFDWQDVYWFKTPVRVHHDDKLYIQCVFDNTAEHQPFVDGAQLRPRDVEWGDQSPDEMCSGLFQAAF